MSLRCSRLYAKSAENRRRKVKGKFCKSMRCSTRRPQTRTPFSTSGTVSTVIQAFVSLTGVFSFANQWLIIACQERYSAGQFYVWKSVECLSIAHSLGTENFSACLRCLIFDYNTKQVNLHITVVMRCTARPNCYPTNIQY